jgi:hypothetical protein
VVVAMITMGRRTEGRTDVMKVAGAFRDYANTPKTRGFSEQNTPSSKPYRIPSYKCLTK